MQPMGMGDPSKPGKKTCNKQVLLKYGVLCIAVAAIVVTVAIVEAQRSKDMKTLIDKISTAPEKSSQTGTLRLSSNKQVQYILEGNRHDDQLQECQGSTFKLSFSDVDYALLGYNILRGYPLATGHDPGFTYPIFRADYSSGGQTADCRYSVPDGLVIVPDVSCVTSFSSTTVRNRFEFAKALSASAHVEGGGWGVKFSASTGYKQSSSEISKGESVYIISSAKCQYYFSKIIFSAAPRFDEVFIQWMHKLNNTNIDETYFQFIDTYGTHFPTEVTFGASFTYEHKMSAKEFQNQTEKGVNVAVDASYSGLINIGGGFNLDSSQRQSASEFSKYVETKTITIGAAPPSNGDAMTWASVVKTSPVPTSYKLAPIESLFTDRFMKSLNIDHLRIHHKISNLKHKYCTSLQVTGQVESCSQLAPGITLENTKLEVYAATNQSVASISECLEVCLQNIKCVAISYCVTCSDGDSDHKQCYMFNEKTSTNYYSVKTDENTDVWQSYVFADKINHILAFANTEVVGIPRGFVNDDDKKANETECERLCKIDAFCVAYTYCYCINQVSDCQLYSEGQIRGLNWKSDTKTVFISSRLYGTPMTSTLPSTTPSGK